MILQTVHIETCLSWFPDRQSQSSFTIRRVDRAIQSRADKR